MIKAALVGLPNVGKTSLFNLITQQHAIIAKHPFSTIKPNIATVNVFDDRLEHLKKIFKPKETYPEMLQLIDVAGLIAGAHRGEGLGNRFLSYIRDVDVIIHILRCFEDETVVAEELSPTAAAEIVQLELALKDIEVIDAALAKLQKKARKDSSTHQQCILLNQIKEKLNSHASLSDIPLSDTIKLPALLMQKPMIYVANFNDRGVGQLPKLREWVRDRNGFLFEIDVKFELELLELDEDTRAQIRKELNFKDNIKLLLSTIVRQLNKITFFTYAHSKLQAHFIPKHMRAQDAAAKIHQDMYRGFIAAEIINYEKLIKFGDIEAAKKSGLVRLEGRDYEVCDGDIITFRFSV